MPMRASPHFKYLFIQQCSHFAESSASNIAKLLDSWQASPNMIFQEGYRPALVENTDEVDSHSLEWHSSVMWKRLRPIIKGIVRNKLRH
jgi:hypothetical protein